MINEGETICKKRRAENFPKLMKDTNIQTQVQQIPSINKKKMDTWRHHSETAKYQ